MPISKARASARAFYSPLGVRHPERSRFSGGAKDLPCTKPLRGRSLAPLVKARGFGMTPFDHDLVLRIYTLSIFTKNPLNSGVNAFGSITVGVNWLVRVLAVLPSSSAMPRNPQ